MRIALVTAGGETSGGVAYTLALAGALVRAGARVTVWSLAGAGRSGPVDPAVRVRTVPFPDVPGEDGGARDLRAVTALGTAFAAAGEEYDVVHAQDAVGAGAVPSCVRTVHSLDGAAGPAGPAGRAAVPPRAVFCRSAAVGAAVRAEPGHAVTVVPAGVDAGRFAAAAGTQGAAGRGRWRARLGRYVLAVGGVAPRPGLLDVVEAMATVQLVRPDVTLVVAGGDGLPGPRGARAVLDARAQELEVYPLVLGDVPADERAALVAAADVVVLPTAGDGSGVAGLEALAAGVPVVARDLPLWREVLGDTAALASSPARLAAAVLAAGDPDPARVAAGRARAAGHTWEAAARAHLRCYAALVAEARQAAAV
ncbi:glycosyltransferase [Blastococcus sp. SYSU D00813]